jgi:outer membrane biosynthesis protein TonB
VVVAAAPKPVLKTLVEPDVPESQLRKRPRGPASVGGNHGVLLDIDIGADGKVKAVRVRESTNPAIEDPVRDAVLRWVYQPMAQAVTETVQLQIDAR